MTTPKYPSLSGRQIFDYCIRIFLGIFFAFSAGTCIRSASAEFQNIDFSKLDPKLFSHALSVLAIGLYTLMVACLYALRLRPRKTASGLWPNIAAILGGFLMSGLLLLNPRQDLPLTAQLTACLLVVTGNVFAVYILTHLGRSFSILPESRKLVTTGPYKIVRHPLYLAEAVATLGAVIVFLSPWSILLVAAQFTLQLVRITYEEKVLTESFPEYAGYAKRTARLIPGIY